MVRRMLPGVVMVAVILTVIGCGNRNSESLSGIAMEDRAMAITLSIPPEDAKKTSKAVAVLSADEMDTIESELFIGESSVSGTISSIPLGAGWHIQVKLFNRDNVMFYYGNGNVDVLSDEPVYVDISLQPVVGTVIINGSIDESSDKEHLFENDNNTIALWYFNEAAGTTVKDYAGDHPLSMLTGNPLWVNALYGGGILFDSSSCVADNSTEFYPQSIITVEALVYIESLPPEGMSPRSHSMIVSNCTWSGSDCSGYELRLTDCDGKVEFIFGDQDGWHSALSEKTVEPHTWYTIAGQYDGEQINVFVDGEEWAVKPYIGKIQSNPITMNIARRGVDQPFFFYGIVDEIRISSILRYP